MAKPKFSDEICECLIESYSNGIPLKYCADSVGIARQTVYDWMNKGKEQKRGKYHQFYLDMQKAKAKFILHHQMKIRDNKDWRASQYLLQCVDPDDYVVTEKKQVKAEVESDVTVNLLERMKQKRKELNDLDKD